MLCISQLKNSERARVQLRETLNRLEGVTKEQVQDRERELVLLVEATERAAVSEHTVQSSQ